MTTNKANPSFADYDGLLLYRGPHGVRDVLFGGRVTQRQVDGINRILRIGADEYDLPVQHIAYVLGTTMWETGKAMHPLRETQRRDEMSISDATAISRLDRAYEAGRLTWVSRPYWRDGWFGRGEVQITHKRNYEKLQPFVTARHPGVDIVATPNAIIEMPEISTTISFEGMTRGLFTGRKLSDFGDGVKTFRHNEARAIINPAELSSYEKVGALSIAFYLALKGALPK